MSSSVTSTSSSTSSSGASGTNSTSNSGTSDALTSLTSNFQDFLSLLTTQLQNQDPTSPMDANQFTSELVQFTGVEAQINTNSSLSQLISLTQASTVVQSTQLLGKHVTATASDLTLQSGRANIAFTASTAEPVTVAVSDASGNKLYETTVNATAGSNTWTWNGQTLYGTTASDGAYAVSVTTGDSSGNTTSLPFTVSGTATGVSQNGSTVDLLLGGLTVDASSVVSVTD
jgi:flagellar basal-body rod modification protein FlgD